MNLMDKIIVKDGDEFVENIYFLEYHSYGDRNIFTSEANLVYDEGSAVVWMGSVGSRAIRPMRTDLPLTQIDDITYELNIAEYKHGPKSMADLF